MAVLLFQIKLKVILLITEFFRIGSTEALTISFERPKDLTMLVLPNKVNFRLFQLFNVFSRKSNFEKLRLSGTFLQLGKYIPRAKTDSFGHLQLNGVSSLYFHLPSHIASAFVGLVLSPEHLSNFSRSSNKLLTEQSFLRKTVVSSAYCVNFISRDPTVIPSILLRVLFNCEGENLNT